MFYLFHEISGEKFVKSMLFRLTIKAQLLSTSINTVNKLKASRKGEGGENEIL